MFLTRRDPSDAADVNIVSTAHVVAENIEWLLSGFLPKKKVTLLAGTPGAGKTSIALHCAAVISSGGTWPDGGHAERGRVLIYSTEDGASDVKARLVAMGADLRNVDVLENTTELSGRTRRFDCQRDLSILQRKLMGKGGYALVIIDPVTSIVAGNTNNNKFVRDAMESLVEFAEAVNCALLCLTHVSKGTSRRLPLERVMGALAYGAVPRVVLIAARINGTIGNSSQRGVLVRAKSNIGPVDGGFEYRIQSAEVPIDGKLIQTSRLDWSPELLEGSADEILKSAAGDVDEIPGGALGRAAEFLQNVLANGPMLCSEVEAHAATAGISGSTLKRARKHVGVLSCKQSGAGPHGQSILYLPGVPATTSGVGNAVGGPPFGATVQMPGRWFSAYSAGQPTCSSALNGSPPPFTNGTHPGPGAIAPAGGRSGDAGTRYPPYRAREAMEFGAVLGSDRASAEASGQVDPVGSVGPVGPVGPVARSQPAPLGARPAWVSVSNWDWLLQEYQNEYRRTLRRDCEDEFDFQTRVACGVLESCPDWDRNGELRVALVDAFNGLTHPGNHGKRL
ncbi:AAA family ATPase [Burkholderia pseudomallei]|uniref:AAA family ATPase n=1 Tax=Burkholderia pseudomallei TaxID=28450 RepID=UPI001AD7B7CA|nr:AAA family ATPase [Burkholderia pseudomallei]